MQYFLKGLLTGNKKFFTIAIVAGIWCVALLDAFTGGVLNRWWFLITLILTAAGSLTFIFYKYFSDLNKRKKLKAVEAAAAIFEPIQEEKIRKRVEADPEFVTLCFKCKYYNHNHRHCSRDMTMDITQQRLKEIRIGHTKYCLYWELPSDQESSEFNDKGKPSVI